MVYMDSNTTSLVIPCHYTKIGSSFTLRLTNNLTNQQWSETMADSSTSRLYYQFSVSGKFSGIVVGEYTYEVLSSDTVVEKGMLVYGDYTPSTKQYDKNNQIKTYKR